MLAAPQTINPPPSQKGREIKVSKLSVKTLSTKNILQKDVNQDSEILKCYWFWEKCIIWQLWLLSSCAGQLNVKLIPLLVTFPIYKKMNVTIPSASMLWNLTPLSYTSSVSLLHTSRTYNGNYHYVWWCIILVLLILATEIISISIYN